MRAFKSGEMKTPTTVTPVQPIEKIITIVCERATVSGRSGIRCEGTTTGFSSGSTVAPFVRFPGETTYTQGSARPEIGADGNFTWSRKTGKKVYVYFASEDGSVTSNRVIVPAS
jgi:hypothetical protein